MDSEKNSSTNRMTGSRRPSQSRRALRPFVLAFTIVSALFVLYRHVSPPISIDIVTLDGALNLSKWKTPATETTLTIPDEDVKTAMESKLVPLEAHIMSKCPDAQFCLRELVLPAMMHIVDKVNFTLSFIGTATGNDAVICKHGPQECLGNIIELCAAKLYPDPKIYMGFTMCMEREYSDIPQKSLIEDCALEHGINFNSLNDCASSDDGIGMEMLRDSVTRTSGAGVTKSCTIRLNEEFYCVRDGGEWKDCPGGAGVNDLIIAVEKLYS